MDDLKKVARSIFERALDDCSIEAAFDHRLRITTDTDGTCIVIDGRRVARLDTLKAVRIVSAGKAAEAMLHALLTRLQLPVFCNLQGVLIACDPPQDLPLNFQFFQGGHPVPTQASFDGASAVLSMLQFLKSDSSRDTLCFFLISGGASAMMELPLDSSISLEDTVAFHRTLVHCGASIVEINCIRKHFSAIKGGRLAHAAGNARAISLFVSDVPPLHLDALASGPTAADPTTVAQCREIIARYSLLEQFPPSIRRYFMAADIPETPKPGGIVSESWTLLDSDDLAKAARDYAVGLGYHTVVDNICDDWSFDAAADYLLDRLRLLRRQHPRVCLISTGEVTVMVPVMQPSVESFSSNMGKDASSLGGRNQHFALYVATQFNSWDRQLAVLSAGSDGIDGNSNAAGAVVDESTLGQHFGDGLQSAPDPEGSMRIAARLALDRFDSSTFLRDIGATIVTGPTGQNLRDIRILLADANPSADG